MFGRKPRVLVTGSSGLIGGVLTRTLGDKYALGLDRVPPDPAPDIPTYIVGIVRGHGEWR